jgi:hypothetical protein
MAPMTKAGIDVPGLLDLQDCKIDEEAAKKALQSGKWSSKCDAPPKV